MNEDSLGLVTGEAVPKETHEMAYVKSLVEMAKYLQKESRTLNGSMEFLTALQMVHTIMSDWRRS
jgi:hypothetical protein